MQRRVELARSALKVGYGLVPIVAGADKFANLLVDWEKYLSPAAEKVLPVKGGTFMKLVGIVEVAAGALVLSRTRFGAWLVAGWLGAITVNLLLNRQWDIAARDALLAIGAAALGVLSTEERAVNELPREPMTIPRRHPEGMTAVFH